jgi:hypothetical protein
MKIFHCDHCGNLLFFENTLCVACGHQVAYLPDRMLVGSLTAADDDRWHSPQDSGAARYRLCRNYTEEHVCNWAIPEDDPHPFCLSCRLTRVIPDLAVPDHRQAWYRLEAAKRRLVFTLLALGLPLRNRNEESASGLAFEFKANPLDPFAPRVLTGHADGVITINVAEADDAERERLRKAVQEPYRTLLGHMRHESGHYYWDQLIRDQPPLEQFRRLFGDERRDYDEALKTHYAHGAPPDWQTRCVSAYASAHPWEDWAETWAHYLHMVDTLETASTCGISLRPKRADEPALPEAPEPVTSGRVPFEYLIGSWFPLTYMLNNLNRGLGLPDAYPFALSTPAVEKLRFVHDVVADARSSSPAMASTGRTSSL